MTECPAFAPAFQVRIAAMGDGWPMMCIIRFLWQASTHKVIPVLTFLVSWSELGAAHPGFERTGDMLDGPPTDAHGIG